MGFWKQYLNREENIGPDPFAFTEEEVMNLVDTFSGLAEIYAGQKAILVNKGFTPEQAGDIVVALRQEAAADALAVANGFKKPE